MLQHANEISRSSLVDDKIGSKRKIALQACVLVLLAGGLFAWSSVRAELASEQEMRNVSQNFVTQKVARLGQWASDPSPVLGEGHELWYEGLLVARYYDVSPRGYVLVPILKEMSPVKAYSDESNLDENQEGGFLQMVGEVLYKQMRLYESLYGSLDTEQPTTEQLYDPSQKQAWRRLEVPVRDFRPEAAQGTTSQGGPLLTSSWHQGAPYNNFCPMDIGGRSVVGCLATATAQILKYWEWPPSGVGTHSYWWVRSSFIEILTADYSDSYDWANMPNDCNGGCSADQANAAAELNYEVGVALNMIYGSNGSGASGGYTTYVFPAYFKYKPNTQMLSRLDYTQEGWFNLMQSEIDAGRPMLYLIFAHAIVCDGYRDDFGQFELHVNYGWNDAHTTWYVLDNLDCYWVEGSICPYQEELMIRGIEPQHDPGLEFQRATVWDTGSDGDSLIEAGETAQLYAVIKGNGDDALSTTGTLSTSDPYLTITGSEATFDPVIVWGAESTTQEPFEFTVDPGCPDAHVASLRLDLAAEGGLSQVDTFQILIGDKSGFDDDFESGSAYWSTRSFTVSYFNQWHRDSGRQHSGSTSWKMGDLGSSHYADNLDGALISPPLLLPPGAKLSFWHRIDAGVGDDADAFDGGIVMIRPNDGDWFHLLTAVDGYSGIIDGSSTCALPQFTHCYSGTQDWTEAVFDLSFLSGVVEVMFRFSSSFGYKFDKEGWYIDDVWVGNTMEGTEVELSLLPDLSVTFESVLTRGTTTATIAGTGPIPPPGYAPMPGAPARYYEVLSDAIFSDNADVCITYDQEDVTGSEGNLKLLHYEDGYWIDVTTSLNTETNQICGSATSLSLFLVAEKLSCCDGRVGDANSEGEYPDEVTLGDIMLLVDVKFISGDCSKLACISEADVNQDGGSAPTCEDHVTLGDIMYLVDFLFIAGPEHSTLPECL